MQGELRRCPVCSERTVARKCEADGAVTVRPVECTAGEIGPGTLLDGRIRIGELIGKGGFAKVWGGVDSGGVELAVKVMSKAYVAADLENIRRFVREAEITSRLVHGNTIRVFDVGQTADGQLLLIMERLRGHALTHRLRHLRHDRALMPVAEAISIGVQVLNSLVEAHGHGLVHRDLKPDNIFLHRAGKGRIVKVIDFGIAHRDGSEMTRVGQVLGTPAYMSPEQARGATIDGRADLYSLGVILFQCLTARIPYPEEDNPLMTMMHHVMSPIPDPREYRPELEAPLAALVMQALGKEPDSRYADASAMRSALRACRGEPATPQRRASSPQRPPVDRRAPRSTAQIAAARGRTRPGPVPPTARPPASAPPPLPMATDGAAPPPIPMPAEDTAPPPIPLEVAPPPLPVAFADDGMPPPVPTLATRATPPPPPPPPPSVLTPGAVPAPPPGGASVRPRLSSRAEARRMPLKPDS
ncbi:MAG: hypothetical protein RIT45_1710 [Pseudomonadota bacterium]